MASPSNARRNFWQPTVQQVVAAVQSLYDDELRPMGRIVLRRLRELEAAARGLADVEDVALVEPQQLRQLCEGCDALIVTPAEGKEYAVELRGVQGVFVDPVSDRDAYSGHMWNEFAEYINGLSDEDCTLPSGRYACAQILAARRLPCFQGRSVGELCHIVQLAVSQKKLLGHAKGHTVKYTRSEECAKLHCAVRRQPLDDDAGLRFATWDNLVVSLVDVLCSSTCPYPGACPLSNLKNAFRARLGLELCETVLGYARLGDALQDLRLRHVCAVEATGNGQSLVYYIGHLAASAVQPQHIPVTCAPVAPPLLSTGSTCASQRRPCAPPAGQWSSALLVVAPQTYQIPLVLSPTASAAHASTSSASGTSSEVDAEHERVVEDKDDCESCASSSTAVSHLSTPTSNSSSVCGRSSLGCTDIEKSGFVVRNGFLCEARARRHVRSRSV